ncbi:MAG: TolC family protein [Deltaproteobacteria bacterium]|nr:TolC family protein [Deltaproteobacteria bacterium]
MRFLCLAVLSLSTAASAAQGTSARTGVITESPPVALPLSRAAQTVERVTFQQALERAQARNPNALIARSEVLRAEALVRQSQAGFLPTLAANGTYTRLDHERDSGTVLVAGRDQLNLNAVVTVPILAPSKWLATSRLSDAVEASRAGADEVKRQLALAAGRSFLSVIAARRQVDIAQRATEVAQQHVEYADGRLTVGAGNRLDRVRAGEEAATNAGLLENALTALERAREALGVSLGADAPIEAADEPVLSGVEDVKAALDQLHTSRADLRAQTLRQKIADSAVSDAWTDYAPLLNATFQPFYNTPQTSTLPETGWQAQLVLTIPLFDGGLRYGQQRERKALAAEARDTFDGLLRQAKSEVRAAFEAVRHADEALTHARDANALAQEEFKLVDEGYRVGRLTSLDLTDAQRRARDAEAAMATAEDNARQTRLELLVAAGRFP